MNKEIAKWEQIIRESLDGKLYARDRLREIKR